MDLSAGLRTAGEIGWGKLWSLSQVFCFRAGWSNRLLLLASSRRQGPTGLCKPKVALSVQDCHFVICYSKRSSWLCRPSGTEEQGTGHQWCVFSSPSWAGLSSPLFSVLGQSFSSFCAGVRVSFSTCRDQSQPFSFLPWRGQGQPPPFLCRGQIRFPPIRRPGSAPLLPSM